MCSSVIVLGKTVLSCSNCRPLNEGSSPHMVGNSSSAFLVSQPCLFHSVLQEAMPGLPEFFF